MAATLEAVRDYWNTRPCNIRHSPAPIGTRAYFDEVERRKYFVEPHIPGFAEFPRWRGKKVLEIGCGIGTDATSFARAGAHYSGTDLSEESLGWARKRFDLFGLNGTFKCGNAEELTSFVDDKGFDLVYSFGVIHHTPHPERIIAEIRNLIAPDGVLKIMLYAKNSWKSAMIEAGFDQPEAQFGCPIANTYTNDEVRALLAPHFEVVDIRQDHIFPYVVEKYRQYEYEREPWFQAMPEAMFRALERSLGWHLCITAQPV